MKIPKLSAYQTVLEVLSCACIVAAAALMIISTGRNTSMWLLFIIALIVYVLMTLFQCSPKLLGKPNMPFELDPAQEESIARKTLSFFGETKLLCVLLLSYLCFSIKHYDITLIPVWVMMVLILICCVIRLRQIAKYKIT